MIKTKNAVFLDLGKCGTSWLEAVLDRVIEHKEPKGMRHRGLTTLDQFGDVLLYTVVRNPFTYYVSHLTYSQKTNGPLWRSVSADAGYPIKTVEQYVEEMNINRRKLPRWNHDNPEQAAFVNTGEGVGMLTMQYVLMADRHFFMAKRSKQEIKDWYERHWFDKSNKMVMINNTNLKDEFVKLLYDYEDQFPLRENWKQILDDVLKQGVDDNTAKNQRLDYKPFHTEKSIQIIKETDDILIDHFGFTFEEI